MEQLPFFEDKFMLLNDALAAIIKLRPDGALESLQHYNDLYHGGKDLDNKYQIAIFLK